MRLNRVRRLMDGLRGMSRQGFRRDLHGRQAERLHDDTMAGHGMFQPS